LSARRGHGALSRDDAGRAERFGGHLFAMRSIALT
jgi:hypothetical protein